MGHLFNDRLSAESICLLRGREFADGDPLVPPLVQSTTFTGSADSASAHQYSRVSNPSVSVLERALGDLESAPPAATFGTGLAAETALLLATVRAGDHVVCGRSVYGGTTRLLRQLLAPLGVESTFVDATDLDAVRGAVRAETRLVFVETPSNPTLDITDIEACAEIARGCGALLAVDNTFLTPVLQRPLDHGADVSVYSTTKFIDGHSVALGGALVSHDTDLLDRIRYVRKCTGSIQSPFNAWLTVNGLKTLPLRIRAQSQNAEAVAGWLADRLGGERVGYPTLFEGAERAIAERQHLGGHGAVVCVDLPGGREAVRRFVSELRVCSFVEHVGSVETLITHPATMTHADVPVEQRRDAGITDGLLRISVGLEPSDEIIRDLERGLVAAGALSEEVVGA